ncbi:MAG: zinc-binding dehydrogenase [Dehalococcoidia bacterium]
MQCCVKTDMGKVEVVDIPIPTPGPGEIVIKTTLSTICGTDMHFLDEIPTPVVPALYPALAPVLAALPGLPMGHEGVGIVHAVGEGVTRFQPGDRVIASCLVGCGKCVQCYTGDYSICTGGGRLLFGTQGEYFVVPYGDINCAKVPDEVSDENAILATDIMSTGFAALERAELKIGDSVAIFAQGPVGLCATAGARARGAGLIIAVESVPERMEAAKRFGANVVINPQEQNPVQEILNLTNGKGVDVSVEAVGLQVTFDAATRVIRAGGTISSVGVYGMLPQLAMATAGGSFLHRKLVTTLCPSGHDRLTHLLDIVRYGNVDLSPLFTHRMKLSQSVEAYDLFRSKTGGVLKIALTP